MNKVYGFALSILVIVLDQFSKYWVLHHLIPYQPREICPGLQLTLAYNTGAAFSFLAQTGAWHTWFFMLLGSSLSCVLMILLWRLPPSARQHRIALSLILGGAIGNLIDRALMGHVIDFIDVYYKTSHWPVFNLADSAICCGAILYVVNFSSLKGKPKVG